MDAVTEKHPRGMDPPREFTLEPAAPEALVVPEGALLFCSYKHPFDQHIVRFLRAFAVPEDVPPKTFLDHWSEAYNRPDQVTVLELRRNVASSYLLALTRAREAFEKAMLSLPTLKHQAPSIAARSDYDESF